MTAPDAPVLIAYDGSDTAREAVREAATLFGSRQVLVVTVWEPDLAYEASMPTGMEMSPVPVDIEGAREVEEEIHQRASRTAQEGAELAQSLGLRAQGLAVAKEVHGRMRSSSLLASEGWPRSSALGD